MGGPTSQPSPGLPLLLAALRSFRKEERASDRAAALRESVHVSVQNVAEFLYLGSTQEHWDLAQDFPNIAPPWPETWMEYQLPDRSNNGGKLVPMPNAGLKVGVLMWSTETSALPPDPRQEEALSRGRWFVGCDLWCQIPGGPATQVATAFFLVTPDGSYLGMDGKTDSVRFLLPEGANPALVDTYQALFFSFFLALSLCHCRNADVREQEVALRPRHQRETGLPRYSVKTLEIGPAQRLLRTDGGMDEHGSIQRALHVVRGHFKDFRQRGLFGRARGVYWWGQTMRGTPSRGIVDKDYAVSPSQGGRR